MAWNFLRNHQMFGKFICHFRISFFSQKNLNFPKYFRFAELHFFTLINYLALMCQSSIRLWYNFFLPNWEEKGYASSSVFFYLAGSLESFCYTFLLHPRFLTQVTNMVFLEIAKKTKETNIFIMQKFH